MIYNFSTHTHRFAIWTAARAVARNFINTKAIREAIEETNLESKLDQLSGQPSLDFVAFDQFHKEASNALINALKVKLGPSPDKVTYGRAAKIIAVYIKTKYILTNPNSSLSMIAHPPIDAILLQNLPEEFNSLNLKSKRWTKLNETAYFNLINGIREINKFKNFWELEQYWDPS